MTSDNTLSRRDLLLAGAATATIYGLPSLVHANTPLRAESFPLEAVRLKPSIFLDAVTANRAYLHSLEPDRLLHNFRMSAGLKPKGAVYGGWESRGIAGHSLGHYLSACSLMHAQTGDEECAKRIAYIVDELKACQAAHGDGYIGGTTVEREGKAVDGKVVFEEVRRGEIRTGGFDLNGGWVPLYTWHKVHAGLLDAHRYCGNEAALQVAVKACGYLAGVLEPLNEEQLQSVLAAEHGGLNETFAETHVRTGDARWLAMARRIFHRKVLDPLVAGRDELKGLHANTQIPKLVGLARLHEITGEPGYAKGAQFFWTTVTQSHSYVIGGNSEREHFGEPRVVSPHLTDQTCEACNTYNMLRLTRHLYSWQPDAGYFDYFERAHLNHTMSHQDPATGLFTYMTPMMSGVERKYSTRTEDFWCCVGSGIESHAKHGESIYWRNEETLFVNLYYASTLNWKERGARFELDTAYPNSNAISFKVAQAPRDTLAIALRIPAWCANPKLTLNGKTAAIEKRNGYAVLQRRWRAGDLIDLTLPMALRVEAAPDNPKLVSFLSGPLVLAADLGLATNSEVLQDIPPVIVTTEHVETTAKTGYGPHTYIISAVARPREITLRPFFSQYQQRTALYFPLFTQAQWDAEKTAFAEVQRRRAELEARTVDEIHLGEMQPERDHALKSNHSDPVYYLGRKGRRMHRNGFVEFTLNVRPGPLTLQATYWGDERNRHIDILIDGVALTTEKLEGDASSGFIDRAYPVPAKLLEGKRSVVLRFETKSDHAVTLYGCRLLT